LPWIKRYKTGLWHTGKAGILGIFKPYPFQRKKLDLAKNDEAK